MTESGEELGTDKRNVCQILTINLEIERDSAKLVSKRLEDEQ
jgi:hypothetical protein